MSFLIPCFLILSLSKDELPQTPKSKKLPRDICPETAVWVTALGPASWA